MQEKAATKCPLAAFIVVVQLPMGVSVSEIIEGAPNFTSSFPRAESHLHPRNRAPVTLVAMTDAPGKNVRSTCTATSPTGLSILMLTDSG